MENSFVLQGMKFYDVYWLENELIESEREAYARECSERCSEVGKTFPSLMDMPLECSVCHKTSLIRDFSGHALEAKCPKCSQFFKPSNRQLVESLYIQAHAV